MFIYLVGRFLYAPLFVINILIALLQEYYSTILMLFYNLLPYWCFGLKQNIHNLQNIYNLLLAFSNSNC